MQIDRLCQVGVRCQRCALLCITIEVSEYPFNSPRFSATCPPDRAICLKHRVASFDSLNRSSFPGGETSGYSAHAEILPFLLRHATDRGGHCKVYFRVYIVPRFPETAPEHERGVHVQGGTGGCLTRRPHTYRQFLPLFFLCFHCELPF